MNQSAQLSIDEVNDLFKNALVVFDHYYKHMFTFFGSKDGYGIICAYGRTSDDIYRYDVTHLPVRFGEVKDWHHVCITRQEDARVVFCW